MKKSIFKKSTRASSLALNKAFAVSEAPHLTGKLVEYRAELEWREGVPYLVSAPVRISEAPENALRTLLRKCLDLPYDGNDPTLQGLSQGEAMIVNLTRQAANGDSDARTAVIDRLLGRPTQNTVNTNLNGDLNTFLDKVAAAEKIVTLEITPTPPQPEYLEDL